MTTPTTVDQLNEIQREWMALQYDAPDAEKRRVFKLMEGYPPTYVSGHDGKGVCMDHHAPLSVTIDFDLAMGQCKANGGRTDVAWNGTTGQWYAVEPNPKSVSRLVCNERK